MNEIKYPEYIYHYTKAENLFKILPEMRLKLNVLNKTNDQIEYLKYFEYSINSAVSNETSDLLNFGDSIKGEIVTILCFSGSNKIEGYNLPTMWAHYAENYAGVALAINTRQFLSENPRFQHFYPINYLAPGSIKSYVIDNKSNKEEIVKAKLFRKRNDWSSENEWRLSSIEGEEFSSIEKSLSSIILGRNFDKDLLPAVKKMIPYPKITIEHLRIDMATQNFYTEPIIF